MSSAVVFAFAIADGLTPVVGAAPFDVLARQIPRALVAQLNGDGDPGLRFFPFLGPVDGQRGFLRLRELLEPAALVGLHQQGDVDLLVDGMLLQDRLQWRVLDGATGAVRLSIELPFDALDPFAVMPRLGFELVGLLGWTGAAGPQLQIRGAALGWYLVLKDDLLRREADLQDQAIAEKQRAGNDVAVVDWSLEERAKFRKIAVGAWHDFAAKSPLAKEALDTHLKYMRSIGLLK